MKQSNSTHIRTMRMEKIVFLFAINLLFLINSQATHAQSVFPSQNGSVLDGQTEFDAIASIGTWLNVEDDRERFASNLQTAFELGLRRDGVIVDFSAPNYLFCTISAAESYSIVFYSYRVEYFLYNFEGVHKLLWTSGGVATVGSSNFDHESVAKDCVDTFSNEWLKQNPK